MKKSNKLFLSITGSLLLAGCLVFTASAKTPVVSIGKTSENGYYLTVDGKPFLMKGVIYNPVPPGKGYNHDFFSDPAKPWLVDGPLMKAMGINCIRIYSAGKDLQKTKAFIHEMYDKFGIYTVVSDWVGLWDGANYADKNFQENTKKHILDVVSALKDENGLFAWILGNENNYTFSGKIASWTSPQIEALASPQEKINKRGEIYYTFVNTIAVEIKKIDPNHPVALGNGENSFLNIAAKVCPDVDALALILYRGKKFGNFFNSIRGFFDKPVFLSEFGCDSYDAFHKREDQEDQEVFLLSEYTDIYKNTVFSGNEKGNCLGGFIFEWVDEWWKHNENFEGDWSVHNADAGWSNGSYYFDIEAENGMNMNE